MIQILNIRNCFPPIPSSLPISSLGHKYLCTNTISSLSIQYLCQYHLQSTNIISFSSILFLYQYCLPTLLFYVSFLLMLSPYQYLLPTNIISYPPTPISSLQYYNLFRNTLSLINLSTNTILSTSIISYLITTSTLACLQILSPPYHNLLSPLYIVCYFLYANILSAKLFMWNYFSVFGLGFAIVFKNQSSPDISFKILLFP